MTFTAIKNSTHYECCEKNIPVEPQINIYTKIKVSG